MTTTIDRAKVRAALVAAEKAGQTATLEERVDAEVARLEAEQAEAERLARIAELGAALNNGRFLDAGRQLQARWRDAVDLLADLGRDIDAWQDDVTAAVNEIRQLGPLPDEIRPDTTDRWSRAMHAGFGHANPDLVVDGARWWARPLDVAATLALAGVAASYDAGLPGRTVSPIRDACGLSTHTLRSRDAIAARTPLAKRIAAATPPAPQADPPPAA